MNCQAVEHCKAFFGPEIRKLTSIHHSERHSHDKEIETTGGESTRLALSFELFLASFGCTVHVWVGGEWEQWTANVQFPIVFQPENR